jgi:hypothetical protein
VRGDQERGVTMASRLGATINKILDLCRAHSQGLPQKVLDEELQDVEVEIMKQSLNFLLQKQKLQVFMQGESIVYREQDTEAAAKYTTFFSFGFA